MVEEIKGIGLELQGELVREVEPSAQSEINLVQRKASEAIPAQIVRTEICNSDRSWEHVEKVERFRRTSIDDRFHLPVPEHRVSQTVIKGSRQHIRDVSIKLMFDVEIRRTIVQFRVRTRHYDSSIRIANHIVRGVRPRIGNKRSKVISEHPLESELQCAVI